MKLASLTMIMMYLAAAGFSHAIPGVTFWNVIYGFAAMLAVFQLLNLRVFWAAGFGGLAYIVIAVKMAGTASSPQLHISMAHIAGLVLCALFCLSLAVHERLAQKNPESSTAQADV